MTLMYSTHAANAECFCISMRSADRPERCRVMSVPCLVMDDEQVDFSRKKSKEPAASIGGNR